MVKHHVRIDKDLEALIPKFVEYVNDEIKKLEMAFSADDFEAIAAIVHKLKGNLGGYGFDELGEIAKQMNDLVKVGDYGNLVSLKDEMKTYLSEMDIEYVEDR